MLEGTLCEVIIQILIRFNSLICRREFQTKSRVSSGNSVGRILSFTGVELDKLKNIMLPTAGFARKSTK